MSEGCKRFQHVQNGSQTPSKLILVQIDWTKVAENPILIQKITNGHAARMRYSRFRASLLGIEPQRRNRNANNKSKVAKSKREPKGKKEKEELIKPDPNAAPDARQGGDSEASIKTEATVKKEAQQTHLNTRLTPAEMPPVPMPDAQLQFHNRLMTPCSETDLFGPASGYNTSPASDMLHHDQPFDYNSAAAVAHCAHEQSSWQPSPSYSPFPMPPYEIESYSAPAAFCKHPHTPHPEGFGIDPSAMMAPDHAPVKHEDWDTRFH